MGNDPEAVLVRVKNRFDPDYDSGLSGGYRNLAVNLRVVTDATMALGVETHVCEVQLLLLSMALIKVRLRSAPSPDARPPPEFQSGFLSQYPAERQAT